MITNTITNTITTLTPSLLSQGGVVLAVGGRVHVYQRSGFHFLEIQEVGVEDAEKYTCSATNGMGTASTTATLSIKGREPISPPHTVANHMHGEPFDI